MENRFVIEAIRKYGIEAVAIRMEYDNKFFDKNSMEFIVEWEKQCKRFLGTVRYKQKMERFKVRIEILEEIMAEMNVTDNKLKG